MGDGVVCPRCGYVRKRACPVGALSCEARQALDQAQREGWCPLEYKSSYFPLCNYTLRTLRSYLSAYGAPLRFVPYHHSLDWSKKRTNLISAAAYRLKDLSLLAVILERYGVTTEDHNGVPQTTIIPSALVAKAMKGDHVAIRQWHQHQLALRALEG